MILNSNWELFLKPNLITAGKVISIILLGMIGMFFYRIAEHLYADHMNLHIIVNMIQAQQAKIPVIEKEK